MSDNNQQFVRVERFCEMVEEEVTVSCDDTFLTCFCSNRPHDIFLGAVYPVRLSLLVLDEYEVAEMEECAADEITKLGRGFGYRLVGRLLDGALHSKCFEFEDNAFESEFAFLNGRVIAINVNRINLKFLSTIAET